jgi:uncharacterized protein
MTSMTMATRKLIPQPIGFPLLSVPDAHGSLHFPDLESSVRQLIQVILRTRAGEQLRQPDFGAGLQEFLNRPNTVATHREIQRRVEEALSRWEARILLDLVEVRGVEGAPNAVRVEIAYRLQRTGVPQTVGLTMQVGG